MDLDNQHIELKNEDFLVSIGHKKQDEIDYTFEIEVKSHDNEILNKTNQLTKGGTWLSKSTEKDNSQTVKLFGNKLIIALDQSIFCLSLPELELQWDLGLDEMPIFEFITIEEDILLRGELQIFRINMNGEIVWSTFGNNIWVNIDGKREMQIIDNEVVLTDFNGRVYRIKVEETR